MSGKAEVPTTSGRDDEVGTEWLHGALGLADGQAPFPWQRDLLCRLLRGENIQALDVPTGLGKTATMAIWLVARARGGDVPRRLVYVVDRRAVVDQATEVAEALCNWVASNTVVSDALGLGGRALPISTLRGQHVDNRDWLADPSRPAIVVGTVDMIGSRLLFSGYGVSPKMRPYHAGLLGADTLIVLDEAHLVPPFEELLRRVESGVAAFGPADLALGSVVPRFKLLSLSATGRATGATALTLSDDDRKHPIVKKRLEASKQLRKVELDGAHKAGRGKSKKATELSRELAAQAWKLTNSGQDGVRCLVFCDARRDATSVVEEIKQLAKSAGEPEPTVELFVGARRVLERTLARETLERHGFLAGSAVNLERAVFLIATSAGEVGVDLDADHMVCDLVAWERMVQRLGRVNRRGDGEATVVVVVGGEPTPTDAMKRLLQKRDDAKAAENDLQEQQKEQRKIRVAKQSRPKGRRKSPQEDRTRHTQREKELESKIKKLRARANRFKNKEAKAVAQHEQEVAHARALRALLKFLGEGGGELSPAALAALKDREDLRCTLRDATTVDPLRPALSRALVDAWSMTSLEEHTGRPEVGPWLRGWGPNDPPRTSIVWRRHLPVQDDGDFHQKAAERFFEAAPPHASELLETETSRAVEWLVKRAARVGVEGNTEEKPLRAASVAAIALTSRGGVKTSWRLEQLVSAKRREEKKHRDDLEKLLVGTVLVVDARLGGLTDGLLDDDSATAEAADDAPADDETSAWLSRPGDPNLPVTGFRIRRFQIAGHDDESVVRRAAPGDGWVERFALATDIVDGEPTRVIVVDGWAGESATEDDRAEASRPQTLEEHQSWAEECARGIASRVGLDEDYGALLALAARLHDEGKRAMRWQRAFRAPLDGIAYAKTRGPVDFTLLDGYRHELGSLSSVEKDAQFQALSKDAQDLVLHLVASHHGSSRPLIGTRGFDDAPPSIVDARARNIALRFAALQRRWGPWGLAWWEALLRASDQAASRRNEQSGLSTEDIEAG